MFCTVLPCFLKTPLSQTVDDAIILAMTEEQNISIYLDDSGILTTNHNDDYFIYAGYVFLSRPEKDSAIAKEKQNAI